MSTIQSRIFRNSYRDSVELMQIAAEIESLPGIHRAGLVMATPANREVLATAGLLSAEAEAAGPNDLVVAVTSDDENAATQALERAATRLSGQGTEGPSQTTRTDVRTLAEGVEEVGGANLALISTPGTYATAEALKALKHGLNVFLFSDNVPVEDEIELKSMARARGLLVMGPDCGTAILDGVPLGFANAVRRGTIGLVGASGTGLQQVTCLIDRGGAGVSQAIGVGGRDLDERVGGTMMLAALERLAADPETQLIVLISKPPSASVTELILAAAGAVGKPVIVNFLGGDPAIVKAAGSIPASTFEVAATIASAMALGRPIPVDDLLDGAASDHDPASAANDDSSRSVREAQAGLDPAQWRIRGLYSGGSLAGEAKLVLRSWLGAKEANRHEIVDLGDDEYTVGRPHPMIDPRLRNEHLAAVAADPSTAVVLLDVVLGYGANADPAGALASAIRVARADAARVGRRFAVVASVCGTSGDAQDLVAQEARLAEVGVILAPSNARAAVLAARIVAPAGVAAGRHE
jgi:FdrA protein